MRLLIRPLLVALTLALVAPAAGAASAVHRVLPGETLSGIAVAHGQSLSALAAANGLSIEAYAIAGTDLTIPTGPAAPSTAPAPMGAYTVRPGDTLSALAAQSRVPLGQMAYVNGLDPAGVLPAGTVIKLPAGATVSAGAPAPTPVVATASPSPTPGRLSAAQVSTIAGQSGAPASLAAAIAWQESGFNNAMVSSANARGIMQVMPGTWDWVQANLSRTRLDPASAADNVRAGSLYLAQLLRQTGGDPALAAAGYYQGLASVRRIGMLPDTRRYVANVLALRGRFGG